MKQDQKSNGHHLLIALHLYGVTGIIHCMVTHDFSPAHILLCCDPQRLSNNRSADVVLVQLLAASSLNTLDLTEKKLQNRQKKAFHA